MDIDVNALLAAVPGEWVVYIAAGLKVLLIVNGVASWLAPLIKRRLGVESKLSQAVDYVAVNTTRAKDSKVIADLQTAVQQREQALYQAQNALKGSKQSLARQEEVIANHEATIHSQAALIAASKRGAP